LAWATPPSALPSFFRYTAYNHMLDDVAQLDDIAG